MMGARITEWIYNRRYWPIDTWDILVFMVRDLAPTIAIIVVLAFLAFTELSFDPLKVIAQGGSPASAPTMPVPTDNPWHSIGIAVLSGLYLLEKSPRALNWVGKWIRSENPIPPPDDKRDFVADRLADIELAMMGNGTEENPGLNGRMIGLKKDVERLRSDFDLQKQRVDQEIRDLVAYRKRP